MYPQNELNALAARKAVIRLSVAAERARCVEAMQTLGRPWLWFSRVRAVARWFAPTAP